MQQTLRKTVTQKGLKIGRMHPSESILHVAAR